MKAELCKMGYHVDNNELVYLYQLQKGACSKSFGINVAKIAGIPVSIEHMIQYR